MSKKAFFHFGKGFFDREKENGDSYQLIALGPNLICRFLLSYLYFRPFVYFILANVALLINILGNVVSEKAVIDSPVAMVIRALWMVYIPYSLVGVTDWVEEFTLEYAFVFLVLQLVMIAVLKYQYDTKKPVEEVRYNRFERKWENMSENLRKMREQFARNGRVD